MGIVSSGGDCSAQHAGTSFLTNTTNISLSKNLFTELGSNGITVADFNQAISIDLNEFVQLGNSAVILVGTINGIVGFTVRTQPTNVSI